MRGEEEQTTARRRGERGGKTDIVAIKAVEVVEGGEKQWEWQM